MKRAFLILVGIGCAALPAQGLKTGIHFAFPLSMPAFQYSTIENIGTSIKRPESLISQNLSLFLSTFKENIFEFNLGLGKEKYQIQPASTRLDRYYFSFELGKLFSFSWSLNQKKFVSPDIGVGGFAILAIFSRQPYNRFYLQYGLYGSIKFKFNVLARPLKLTSVDCGYKLQLPVHDALYSADAQILHFRHFIFIGLTF